MFALHATLIKLCMFAEQLHECLRYLVSFTFDRLHFLESVSWTLHGCSNLCSYSLAIRDEFIAVIQFLAASDIVMVQRSFHKYENEIYRNELYHN